LIHRSILAFRSARYLWISLALTVASVVLYFTQTREQPPNGGTWQGYVLGTIGALLIVWLTLLAVRKRKYHSTLGSVQGWTSAHVYLGTALLVIATLHCGVQFGWNVHTLAYALMCIVIVSGFFGLYSYLVNPSLMAQNRKGSARPELFAELYHLNKSVRTIAERCSAPIATAVSSAVERTTIGGGVIAQLFARDSSRFLRTEGTAPTLTSNRDQQGVIDFVAKRLPAADKVAEAASLQELVVLLCRRQVVLRRIRREIKLYGWIKTWLYVHVPVTLALLVSLMVHILVTFAYW
jgi:hypothetical protein